MEQLPTWTIKLRPSACLVHSWTQLSSLVFFHSRAHIQAQWELLISRARASRFTSKNGTTWMDHMLERDFPGWSSRLVITPYQMVWNMMPEPSISQAQNQPLSTSTKHLVKMSHQRSLPSSRPLKAITPWPLDTLTLSQQNLMLFFRMRWPEVRLKKEKPQKKSNISLSFLDRPRDLSPELKVSFTIKSGRISNSVSPVMVRNQLSSLRCRQWTSKEPLNWDSRVFRKIKLKSLLSKRNLQVQKKFMSLRLLVLWCSGMELSIHSTLLHKNCHQCSLDRCMRWVGLIILTIMCRLCNWVNRSVTQ